MGRGTYNVSSAFSHSADMGYAAKSVDEVFKARKINIELDPKDIKLREARDSKEHPNSLPIIIALDVTGSMGHIPHELITKGLAKIMQSLQKNKVKDAQVLFLAIGDHTYDYAPLQVSQFESNDQLLDKWLQKIYLEGGGGANNGESYHLAWYFASKHTSIDSFEKRQIKGFLFTIGDEPVLQDLPQTAIHKIMTSGEKSYSASELLSEASKSYNVYHIHVREGSNGHRQEVIDGWKQLMKDNLLIAERHQNISEIIATTIKSHLIEPISVKSDVIGKDNDEPKEESYL